MLLFGEILRNSNGRAIHGTYHNCGFHDFRRAFASVNVPRLKPETLQKLMRHRSYVTTLGYINLASQPDDAITSMPLPKVLRKDEGQQEEGDASRQKKPDDQGSSG